MARSPIFSQIHTAQHPLQTVRLDPQIVRAGMAGIEILGRESQNLVRLLHEYPLAHVGTQTFNLTVPTGREYDGATVITLPPTTDGALVSIDSQPSIGSRGNQSLSLKYTIPPGGQVRYRVRAYAQPTADPGAGNTEPEYEVLYVRDMESVQRLTSLMQSKKRVILLVQGDDAVKLVGTGLFSPGMWKLKTGPFGIPQVEINPTWEWVAIAAIIAAAAVAIVVLLVLETMVIMGILYGYRVEVGKLELGSVKVAGITIQVTLPTLAFVLEPA